jgi:hypothetical protein
LWIVFLLHHMFSKSVGDESVNQESVV